MYANHRPSIHVRRRAGSTQWATAQESAPPMSLRITLSIPQALAARIAERRGDQSVQEYALSALRAAVYGSSAELALRAEVVRLHATVRALGGASSVAPANSAAPVPSAEVDTRMGW